MSEEFVEHGVKLGFRPEDWVAGSIGALSFEERNPSGDWRPYLVAKEYQKAKEDSMSCVSFSAISSIEMQEKFLTGVERNYSDRWIAKMSGTTVDGNWLWKVGDTIRNLGLVAESSYPAPANFTFAQYHAEIPEAKKQELLKEGQAWKQKWDVKTEFINTSIGMWYTVKEDLMKHIKHAPLQIVKPGHAIVNFLCEQDIVNYFDTYKPFEKKLAYSNIQTAYKYVLTPKNMYTTKKVKVNGAYGVLVGMPNTVSITLAEDETEWRSYSKPDSYGVKTVNGDGTTNWDVDLEVNFQDQIINHQQQGGTEGKRLAVE